GSRGFRADAAELVVIDQFGDGRLGPADGTFRIAPKFQFAKLHVEGVEEEEAPNERTAFAQCQLQDFGCLDCSHNTGQYSQHATFRTAWDHSWGRRFRIETAVTRSTEVRGEDAGLSFKPENGAVDVR